jgi:hypothetical protein
MQDGGSMLCCGSTLSGNISRITGAPWDDCSDSARSNIQLDFLAQEHSQEI